MMLRVEPQCYHGMSRCSGVCMSIDTQIFISCDLPVSPRSSQFELRPRLPSTTTWQGNGGSPSSTDLGMDTLVCALNGHELLSCSGSATGGLRASPSTNCELREWRTANCSAIREISIDEMRTF